MAGRRSYGEVLREARERHGFDIASMARKLHIRPDILKAIEEGDFERTPARGYTRNMVRSYAINLGLDASRITEMYLNEVHAFETGRPRSGANYSNGYNSYIRHRETGRSAGVPRGRGDLPDGDSRYSGAGMYEGAARGRQRESSRSRDRYAESRSGDFRDSYSSFAERPGSSSRNVRRSSMRRASSDSRSRRGDAAFSGEREEPATRRSASGSRRTGSSSRRRNDARRSDCDVRANRNPAGSSRGKGIGEVYVGQPADARGRSKGYSSIYSNGASGANGGMMDKLPFLGIVAAVAIVVIIVLVLLFNGSKQSADSVPDIPISGLTDTSNPEGSINSNVTETAPTEAVFRYAVDEGSEAWIEIYENGSDTPSFAGIVAGPEEQDIKVTDKLVMLTANPGPVHAAVDGKAVEFTQDGDSAYYRCEVDFKEILDEWKKEHPTINISSSSSSSGT